MGHQRNLAAKQSGLQWACVNNDDFIELVSGGGRRCSVSTCTVWSLLNAFKMAEPGKQQISIKFCIKLEHSPMKTIWMIQKATVMGNWWSAASTRQHAHSCITSRAEFFSKTSSHPGDSAPYSPDSAPCGFRLFPKLKFPLKGKRFQTIDEIQENATGQLMGFGRTMRGPKVPAFKGTEASLSCVQCFCVCILFNKCLYFS